jgi:hypothetical protein
MDYHRTVSWFLEKSKSEQIEVLSELLRLERFASSNRIFWSRIGTLYSLRKAKVAEIIVDAFEIKAIDKLFECNSWQEIQERIYRWSSELKKTTGIHFARCITAETLTAKSRSKLNLSLKNVLNGDSEVQFTVDPKIIGGIVIELDGIKFDSSYANMLDELEERFTKYMLEENIDE